MDTEFPWPLSEIRMILGLDVDEMEQDFIGVKIGDVNGSAISSQASGRLVNTHNGEALELMIDNTDFESGDIVSTTLRAGKLNDLTGLQFTLNTNGLKVVDVVTEGLDISEVNYAVLTDEKTTFSWNSSDMVSADELFTIYFKATSSGSLEENLSITSDITPAEAYAGNDLKIIPVTLIGRNNSGQEFTLYQNNPNPFNGATDISFNLPIATKATVSIMDVTGKLIFEKSNYFSKGMNTVTVNADALNTGGVLYYKVETEKNSATMKMIVLK